MVESVLAPIFFAVIVLAVVVYALARRARRSVAERDERAGTGAGPSGDERQPRRRAG